MPTAEGQAEILHSIRDTKLEVRVALMEQQFSIGELVALTPGSVLHFDQPSDALATLYVNGKAVADGNVVKIRDNFGLKIDSVRG